MISGKICAAGIVIGYVLWFIWIARELGKAPLIEDKDDERNNEKKEEDSNGIDV